MLTPAVGNLEGYTSASDTERRILRDVFERGDAWYRTGDLMRRDEHGFYYFVDRIGDTFRWKGENVATSEVAAALTEFPDQRGDGLRCRGARHRRRRRHGGNRRRSHAGFRPTAAASDESGLRGYARPLFLRLTANIAATSTFKHNKNQIAREGFNVSVVRDEIYFDDPEEQAYVLLDAALHERIGAGKIRL